MQWRFWKWKKHRPGARKELSAEPDAEIAGEILQIPLPVSSREILGLQQLIGNQAVLQIMNRRVAEDGTRAMRRH
jgi:hypothetical protein